MKLCKFISTDDTSRAFRCSECGRVARTSVATNPADILSACGEVPFVANFGDREFRLTQLRAGGINSIRSYLDIQADCTATEDNATARLDQCLACDEFSGTCCKRISGTCATKYPQWIEVICEGTCERFTKE